MMRWESARCDSVPPSTHAMSDYRAMLILYDSVSCDLLPIGVLPDPTVVACGHYSCVFDISDPSVGGISARVGVSVIYATSAVGEII